MADQIDYLSETVRRCAMNAYNEADFLTRLRRDGVQVHPKWNEAGSRIVGYAARPGHNDPWVSDRTLGSDLTLPSLRELWQQTRADEVEAQQLWEAPVVARPERTRPQEPDVTRARPTNINTLPLVLGVLGVLALVVIALVLAGAFMGGDDPKTPSPSAPTSSASTSQQSSTSPTSSVPASTSIVTQTQTQTQTQTTTPTQQPSTSAPEQTTAAPTTQPSSDASSATSAPDSPSATSSN